MIATAYHRMHWGVWQSSGLWHSPLQMEEEWVKSNPDWVEELGIMTRTKVKAEIQALSSFGFQYLTHIYLPLKLQEGDWI